MSPLSHARCDASFYVLDALVDGRQQVVERPKPPLGGGNMEIIPPPGGEPYMGMRKLELSPVFPGVSIPYFVFAFVLSRWVLH